MAHLLYSNQAESTLAGSISSSATVANLASGTGAAFPNPGTNQAFYLTFNDAATGLLTEIVLVTGRSTNQITIVRGQQGTTAQSWNANDLANQLTTAGDLTAFIQPDILQSQSTNAANDTGTANAIVIALSPTPNPFAFGTPIRVRKGATANTGNVTVQITGLGTYQLLLPGGAQVNPGQLPANGIFTAVFDGTALELQSGGITGIGTAAYKAASNNSAPNLASIVGSVAVGDFAVWADVNGSLKDGGKPGTAALSNASNPLLSAVASVLGSVTPGDIAIFSDANGTIEDGGAPTAPATNAQMEAGISTAVYASPSNLYLHPALPKAWVFFYGQPSDGLCAIISSFNVSSVTRTGQGTYTVQTFNLTLSSGFAHPTANYGGLTPAGQFVANGGPGSGANPSFNVVYGSPASRSNDDPNESLVLIFGIATN